MELSQSGNIDLRNGTSYSFNRMFYQIGLNLHRWLYQSGIKKINRLPVPVICVGNLTTGGSGKTPLVIALAEILKELNFKPAVISRGYNRKNPSPNPVIVSDGNQVISDLENAGDEPLMIAQALDGTPVVVCANRFEASKAAIDQLGADIIVMDDGFQHWALERDLNLICISANLNLEKVQTVPLGPFRENLTALERASAVLITRETDANLISQKIDFVSGLKQMRNKPVWSACYPRFEIANLHTGEIVEQETLQNKKILSVCALANPEFFQDTIKQLGLSAIAFNLPDHDPYNEQTLTEIEKRRKQMTQRPLSPLKKTQ